MKKSMIIFVKFVKKNKTLLRNFVSLTFLTYL